jgi:hypothetical protein
LAPDYVVKFSFIDTDTVERAKDLLTEIRINVQFAGIALFAFIKLLFRLSIIIFMSIPLFPFIYRRDS